MPYISTDKVREYRQTLKKMFPGWKLSVRTEGYSQVAVSIMNGPLYDPTSHKGQQINPYYIESNYSDHPEWIPVLNKIKDVITKDNYTVCVDGDYGNIPNYYIQISIGKWDRPYTQVK